MLASQALERPHMHGHRHGHGGVEVGVSVAGNPKGAVLCSRVAFLGVLVGVGLVVLYLSLVDIEFRV